MSKSKEAKCPHGPTREVITAKEVEVRCRDCKEILYTRKRVLSSNVFSIGRVGKVTEVQFMHAGGPGACYTVKGMSEEDHDELMKSKSKGAHYAAAIKTNKKYKIEKVGY